jgi:hypothetical protein
VKEKLKNKFHYIIWKKQLTFTVMMISENWQAEKVVKLIVKKTGASDQAL